MAAKKTTLNELGDMLTHVVKHMATKDDIARLDMPSNGTISRSMAILPPGTAC
jgi:hypothetical protein